MATSQRRSTSIGSTASSLSVIGIIATILLTNFNPACSLSMVISSWRPAHAQSSNASIPSIDLIPSKALVVPSIRISMSSARGVNGIYEAQDPQIIPTGFVRMCSKAGGFAPRPLWVDLTNGITPWFESKEGCFIYFNCHDSHWWIDDSTGAGMFLAAPDNGLLLPPSTGWTSLTGKRAGAPMMSFF